MSQTKSSFKQNPIENKSSSILKFSSVYPHPIFFLTGQVHKSLLTSCNDYELCIFPTCRNYTILAFPRIVKTSKVPSTSPYSVLRTVYRAQSTRWLQVPVTICNPTKSISIVTMTTTSTSNISDISLTRVLCRCTLASMAPPMKHPI